MKKTILLFFILVIFFGCKDDEMMPEPTPSLTDYPLTFEFNRIEADANMDVHLFTDEGEITTNPTSNVVKELSNNVINQREDWVYQSLTLYDDGRPSEIVLSENEASAQDDYNPITYGIVGNSYVFTTANNIEIQSTVNEDTNELTIPYYSYYKISSQSPMVLRGHAPQSFVYYFVDTMNFIEGDTMATIQYDVIYKLAD